jgi:hypothetical protein
MPAMPDFCHAESGLTRFPPNVEQITVFHDLTCTWLTIYSVVVLALAMDAIRRLSF